MQNRTLLVAAILFLLAATPSGAVRYRIDTWAGGGTPPPGSIGDGGPATDGVLNHPSGLARGRRGQIFVADHDHARVRRIARRGRARVIDTLAGTGERGSSGDEGPAREARFVLPTGLATTRRGDLLVVDAGNDREGNTVRRIDARGIVHRFAGRSVPGEAGTWGPAVEAELRTPLRAAVARNGDVYVVELNNHRVRVVRSRTGILEPFAGNGTAGDAGDGGPAVDAHLDSPAGLAVDPRRGIVYVADFGNDRIRMVTPDGVIHALAGTGVRTGSIDGEGGDPRDDRNDGVAGAATFYKPTGLALDRDGSLLVADQGNHVIRRILPRRKRGPLSAESGVETIVGDGVEGFAGDGGDALAARLSIPTDVLPLGGGRLLVADRGNHRLRIVVLVRRSLCRPGCNDGNPCTVDRCDPEVGCSHVRKTDGRCAP